MIDVMTYETVRGVLPVKAYSQIARANAFWHSGGEVGVSYEVQDSPVQVDINDTTHEPPVGEVVAIPGDNTVSSLGLQDKSSDAQRETEHEEPDSISSYTDDQCDEAEHLDGGEVSHDNGQGLNLEFLDVEFT